MKRMRQGGENTEMARDPRGMERAVCWGWVSKLKREKEAGSAGGSEVEMTALLMRCWGSNGASFAREMKLSPALSAVLVLQSLASCVGRVLALGAPSTLAWEGGCCSPLRGLGVICCCGVGLLSPSSPLLSSKPHHALWI